MAKFEQLAETTNLMKLNSLEPLLPCYFSLPCCEDHGSPSHGDKCPHVWNLAKKAEVPNTLTSWHSKLSFYVISVEFTAWSCILELQSGFAQRPYWRARVSTGHPNRSWTLHFSVTRFTCLQSISTVSISKNCHKFLPSHTSHKLS